MEVSHSNEVLDRRHPRGSCRFLRAVDGESLPDSSLRPPSDARFEVV